VMQEPSSSTQAAAQVSASDYNTSARRGKDAGCLEGRNHRR
jgi:hypothetical protein